MTRATALGNVPCMSEPGWKERIRKAIDAQETDMKAVSKKAKLGETYVRDMLACNGP